MSLFKFLPSEIEDNHTKVSVGMVIRKVTCYLHSELLRVIKELAPMQNLENKKNTLQILIRESYNAVKKLKKFVENAKIFYKISKLDKLSVIMYEFNSKVAEAVNQIYFTNEMCKFYRLPAFDLSQSSKVVSSSSHLELKMKISSAIQSNIRAEKKENIFLFSEKFFYRETLEEAELSSAFEKLKLESMYLLDLPNKLLTMKDFQSGEFVSFKNNIFEFRFGDIIFHIFPFNFIKQDPSDPEVKNIQYMSYFCKDILLHSNHKYFSDSLAKLKSYLPLLNNNLIFPNIQIIINETDLNLQLNQLQNILRSFLSKYFYKIVFEKIKSHLKENLLSKSKVPFKIKINTKNEIIFYLRFDLDPTEFTLGLKFNLEEINLDSTVNDFNFANIQFHLVTSHHLISLSPLIFIKDVKDSFFFNHFDYFNFEILIAQKIQNFEKIYIHSIFQKVKKIKSIFLPLYVRIDEENSKISILFKPEMLLFSLFIDLKGSLQVTDEKYIFSSNKENNHILREYCLNHIRDVKNIQKETSLLEFNEFLFYNFLNKFFALKNMSFIYEKFDSAYNHVQLKFILSGKICVLIPLQILEHNNYQFGAITCEDLFEDNKKEKLGHLNYSKFSQILDEELHNFFKKFEKNNLTLATFNNIANFILHIQITYNSFFKNLIEISSQVKALKIETEKIQFEIKDFLTIDNSSVELFNTLFEDIQIYNKNLIIKIKCREKAVKSYFFKLDTFCIFDNDNIICFDKNDFTINFYFITKTNIRTISDVFLIKRFCEKILLKLIAYIKKQIHIINQEDVKKILIESENVLISPIGWQCKHNFFGLVPKTIIMSFSNKEGDKKNTKFQILPLDGNFANISILDTYYRHLQDMDEKVFWESLNIFILTSLIYSKLLLKFPSYILPVSKTSYESLNNPNKVVVLMKDFRTFHIIKQGLLSLFVEIVNTNRINIFSSYLWNPETCSKFIKILVEKNDDSSHNGRPILVLEKDNTSSLIHDLETLFELIDKFNY